MNEGVDYSGLPEHMQRGFRLWIEEGIATGHFLVAFVSNNLKEAMISADDVNRYRLFDIFTFLWNEAPSACWGSAEKVEAWRKLGGQNGIRPRAESNQEGETATR